MMKKIPFIHFWLNKTIVFGICLNLSACMPSFLKKYTDSDSFFSSSSDSAVTANETGNKDPVPMQVTIMKIARDTYVFKRSSDAVWSGVINSLMQNYNINIADRENGLITTEWDKYYRGNELIRNKISARINRRSGGQTIVQFKNTVETLKSAGPAGMSSVWVPLADNEQETSRIIKNTAILMQIPFQNLGTELAPQTDIARKSSSFSF